VIVDGYSTGGFLVPAFARLGVPVVHVLSTSEPRPSMAPPDLAGYIACLTCPDEAAFTATASAISSYQPLAVLPGSEAGVPMADRLSEHLGLATNGTLLSPARRDKYAMIETLRAAGVRCARQFSSSDPSAVLAWAAGEGDAPVVIKPLSSASSQNVRICRGAVEIDEAVREVLAATTMFGDANHAALAQSYLEGTEYVVDTVSSRGQRRICGVWEYEKETGEGGRPLYDRDVLLDPDDAPVPQLIDYVDTVLEALGICHGPAHAEVIMTPDGPTLVEIAARLNGNLDPGFHDRCLDANQVDLTALAYARPDDFRKRFGNTVYSRLRHGAVYNTRTRSAGVVTGVDAAVVARIAALPTVHQVKTRLSRGRRIRPTVDLLSSPLRVFMVGDDAATLRADHQAVAALEDNVYHVRPDAGPAR